MRKVLLVTTLPNRVAESLSEYRGVALTVIDISHKDDTKEYILNEISTLIAATDFDILLTYRCPYLIPKHLYTAFSVAVNIHPLELPRFAGLNPWEEAIAMKIDKSCAVLHHLADTADAGSLIAVMPYQFPRPLDLQTAREAADLAATRLLPHLLP